MPDKSRGKRIGNAFAIYDVRFTMYDLNFSALRAGMRSESKGGG